MKPPTNLGCCRPSLSFRYSLNQYGGNSSVVVDPGATCKGVTITDEIDGEQSSPKGKVVRQTVVRRSLHMQSSTSFVFDFSDKLLFGAIDSVMYSLELDPNADPSGIALSGSATTAISHVAVRLNSTAVKVVTSAAVDGTVHMTVRECV